MIRLRTYTQIDRQPHTLTHITLIHTHTHPPTPTRHPSTLHTIAPSEGESEGERWEGMRERVCVCDERENERGEGKAY
jgi:hypothetical protein